MEGAATTSPSRGRIAFLRLAVGVLAITTGVAAVGRFRAASEGRGIPPDCYTSKGTNEIQFSPSHGNAAHKATFAVAESDSEVTLGCWEDVDNNDHTDEAYGSVLTYQLTEPLGDRNVVDPSGETIPVC